MPIIVCLLLIGGMLALELIVDQDDEHALRVAKIGMIALLPAVIGILVFIGILM